MEYSEADKEQVYGKCQDQDGRACNEASAGSNQEGI